MGKIIKASAVRSKPKRLGKEAEKARAELIATMAAGLFIGGEETLYVVMPITTKA